MFSGPIYFQYNVNIAHLHWYTLYRQSKKSLTLVAPRTLKYEIRKYIVISIEISIIAGDECFIYFFSLCEMNVGN